ncbi:MAG: HPr-rel-A system PqqD family peptide chaperone [Thiohalocapsa sp.]
MHRECWQLVDGTQMRWQAWEGGFSLFHGLSGDTHLLSPLPAELLLRLSRGPLIAVDLADVLADACSVDNNAAWRKKLDILTAELEALELIEPVDCPPRGSSR